MGNFVAEFQHVVGSETYRDSRLRAVQAMKHPVAEAMSTKIAKIANGQKNRGQQIVLG
jgi:hypothetical protein